MFQGAGADGEPGATAAELELLPVAAVTGVDPAVSVALPVVAWSDPVVSDDWLWVAEGYVVDGSVVDGSVVVEPLVDGVEAAG